MFGKRGIYEEATEFCNSCTMTETCIVSPNLEWLSFPPKSVWCNQCHYHSRGQTPTKSTVWERGRHPAYQRSRVEPGGTRMRKMTS